jgi:putative flippase GtrA
MLGPWLRPAAFALVGFLNTALDFTVFFAIVSLMDAPILVANVVSYACGVVCSYILNRYVTFRDRVAHPVMAPAFFVAASVIALVINTLTVMLLAPVTDTLIAKIGATAISFVWNYLFSNLVVFRVVPKGSESKMR